MNIKHKITCLLISSLCIFSCTTSELQESGVLVAPTVLEDSTLPSIVINGTTLHSEAFGNPTDPMVIAIHGGPGVDYKSILNFKDLAKDGYYVVFYDQRGSGLSQRHDEEHYDDKVVQFFIDDLSAVIEYYRTSESQRLILAGHSWGAMLATAYINQNPQKVDQVILAEPGGFTWPQTEAYISRSLQLKPFSESTNDLVYVDQFLTGNDHEVLDYKLSLFMAAQDTGDVGTTPIWRLGAVLSDLAQNYAMDNPEELNFTANLSSYTNSVLFAYSENNEHYGLEHAQLVSAAYRNVQLEQINDCGHEIIHYGWDAFYPIVKAYLK